jgi:hypothetical protein
LSIKEATMVLLKLSDDGLQRVMEAALHLPPPVRSQFLKALADALRGCPDPGAGDLDRALRHAFEALRLRWVG